MQYHHLNQKEGVNDQPLVSCRGPSRRESRLVPVMYLFFFGFVFSQGNTPQGASQAAKNRPETKCSNIRQDKHSHPYPLMVCASNAIVWARRAKKSNGRLCHVLGLGDLTDRSPSIGYCGGGPLSRVSCMAGVTMGTLLESGHKLLLFLQWLGCRFCVFCKSRVL